MTVPLWLCLMLVFLGAWANGILMAHHAERKVRLEFYESLRRYRENSNEFARSGYSNFL